MESLKRSFRVSDPAGQTKPALSPRAVEIILTLIVSLSAAALAISPLLWGLRNKVALLGGGSEFFSNSWVYAVRWGYGEQVFAPHMQILYPIFSFINKTLNLTSGGFDTIVHNWHEIAFWWPIFLMVLNVSFLLCSIDRRHLLIDSITSSVIFILSIPMFLFDQDLESVAYHSLAITLGLLSLFFWRLYGHGWDHKLRFRQYVLLGLYTVVIVLGKPTFVEFVLPFYFMEIAKSVRSRSLSPAVGVVASIALSLVLYVVYMFWFYGGYTYLERAVELNRAFYSGQLHVYDASKGASPLAWYKDYVVGVMGPLPSVLISLALISCLISRQRVLLLSGAIPGIVFGLFVLYMRSQSHAHPEFMALLLAVSLGCIRCSGIYDILSSALASHWVGRAKIGATAASVVVVAVLYPLPLLNASAELNMARNDAFLIPLIMYRPAGERTIVVEDYPEVFDGAIDTWCFGSSNLVDLQRSTLLDERFGNATCVFFQETDGLNLKGYNRVVFQRREAVSLDDALVRMTKVFPHVFRGVSQCKSLPPFDEFGHRMIVSECAFQPPG